MIKYNNIEFVDNICNVYCNRDIVFIIDKEDYKKIKNYRWTAYKKKNNGDYYIQTDVYENNKRIKINLHRHLMDCIKGDGKIIDHINGNTLDNRKCNLRVASSNGNQRNSKAQCNSKTGIAGVGFHKASGKYRARIVIDNKEKYLGIFDTVEEALEARKKAEMQYFKEFARC